MHCRDSLKLDSVNTLPTKTGFSRYTIATKIGFIVFSEYTPTKTGYSKTEFRVFSGSTNPGFSG
jgi:hypothetical protein